MVCNQWESVYTHNFVIKLQCVEPAFRVMETLAKKDIRVNCTLIFSAMQALQAMRSGAYYISPFIGWKESNGEEVRDFAPAVAEARLPRDADLLAPTYYLAPGLTAEFIFGQLQEFARRAPNWIVGDPDPAYTSLVERLRRRGVVGPLWSYFAMMQRLWPQGVPGGTVR